MYKASFTGSDSQNGWCWKAPLEVIWSNSLLKQGYLEPVAQGCVQTAFEYLQGWRLHNLSGQPVPVLGHPDSKKVFPDVQRQPPVFQLVPIASGPGTRHHWKEPGSVLFALSLQVFIYIDKIPSHVL